MPNGLTIELLWIHCGFTMELLWLYYGFTVDLLWLYYGFTMDLLGIDYGWLSQYRDIGILGYPNIGILGYPNIGILLLGSLLWIDYGFIVTAKVLCPSSPLETCD